MVKPIPSLHKISTFRVFQFSHLFGNSNRLKRKEFLSFLFQEKVFSSVPGNCERLHGSWLPTTRRQCLHSHAAWGEYHPHVLHHQPIPHHHNLLPACFQCVSGCIFKLSLLIQVLLIFLLSRAPISA